MPKTDSQRAARDKWDAANMAYQTVKVRRETLDAFRAACAARGERVNTVLRQAMEDYTAAARAAGPMGRENEKKAGE